MSHFIFTNSLNFIEIRDHHQLITQLFHYAVFLNQLQSTLSNKYYIEILLLLILHVKQAEQQQITQDKKKKPDNSIKDISSVVVSQSSDKMEAEQTRD